MLERYLASPLTPDDPPRQDAAPCSAKSGTDVHGEALRSSVEALRANKFRAFLTALGLVIGNASVILVVTISLTSRDYILDQIQRIGSNLIYAQYDGGNNPAMATADADYIKIADVEAVREQLGSRIVAATGVMNNFDRMRIEGREEDVAIIGTDEYYPQVRNLELLAGRFLDAGRRGAAPSRSAAHRTSRAAAVRRPAAGGGPNHQAARHSIRRHRHVQGADRYASASPNSPERTS